jgi:hypothetical protein
MNNRSFGRILTVIGVISISASMGLIGETRRALLIGINKYVSERSASSTGKNVSYLGEDRNWVDLKGCINDALAMKELLEKKFHFKPENITVLSDVDRVKPTGQAIIDGIKRLIADSTKGDVALFYYSGHGSQFISLENGEEKRRDETIVPSDSIDGAKDIRDKDFARLFNGALDKGIILTAIFDSCHSGSICRGFSFRSSDKGRSILPVQGKDPEPPEAGKGLKPEERMDLKERGILVLTAAQDNETAWETSDEEAREGSRARGAFSLALTRILATVPENEPASRIFNRLPSALNTNGNIQIPVFSGTKERMAAPLFGVGSAGASRGIRVAALKVNGQSVVLHGGSAVGIADGCELKMEAAQGQPFVRIRVTEVNNLAQSTATVIAGPAAAVKPGSIFLVDKWTYSNASGALKVWWPRSSPTLQEIEAVRSRITALKNSGQIVWVEDPTEDDPDWIVSHDGRSWALIEKAGRGVVALKQPLETQEILDAARKSGRRPKVFVAVPAPAELVGKLALGSGTANDALIRTEKGGEADYALIGRITGDGIQVAWMAQNRIKDMDESSLPLRSDWRAVSTSAEALRVLSASLEEDAQNLQIIKGWLNLRPKDDADSSLPYHLAFKNIKSGRLTTGPVQGDESYNAVLVRDDAAADSFSDDRRIYVFVIDSWGEGTLLYPRLGENGNTLSRLKTGGDIVLKDDTVPFTIGEPYGYDTYYILTSDQPLGDLTSLSFKGVRTRGPESKGIDNPLARLLKRVGSATRGDNPSVAPPHWTIDHIVVKSVPAK